MDADECLCIRCARRGRTCCQWTDIYVTLGDVRRIRRHGGVDDFYEFRSPTNPAYVQQGDDPVWERCVFQVDGTRRVLKRRANGDCIFLTAHGCRLPPVIRPLICRLHPYQYNAAGITDELAPDCPTHLLGVGESVIEAIQMNPDRARIWHAELYRELEEENTRAPGAISDRETSSLDSHPAPTK
jgi:Fe-S-cluster containining protein